MNVRYILLTTLVAAWMTACGGSGGGGGSDDDDVAGVDLLAGDAAAVAVDALPAIDPIPAPADERSGDLLLSRIRLVLEDGATIGEFNEAASAAGATGIASAEPGSPYVSLIVPRAANGRALFRLLDRIEDRSGVLAALPSRQFAGMILPGQAQGSPQSPDLLGHLLPARFPAAWNAAFREDGELLPAAAACTPAEATVLVVDLFGSIPANAGSQLAGFANSQRFGAFAPGPEEHGWQVAAVLGSAFDELLPTGGTALPECVDFVLIDVLGIDYIDAIRRIRMAVDGQLTFDRLIANFSVGYGTEFCGPNGDAVCNPTNLDATPRAFLEREMENRIWAAISWAEISNDQLDARLLIVQAAGNEAAERPENGGLGLLYDGIADADFGSPFTLATFLNLLTFEFQFSPLSDQARSTWTSDGHPSLLLDEATAEGFMDEIVERLITRIPGRSNLLVVGSSTSGELSTALSRSNFSNDHATVFAVGEAVPGLGGVLLDGTSVAAPQLTALAAWLWSVSELEDQPVFETRRVILGTAAPITVDDSSAPRFVDAYAATLALDAFVGTLESVPNLPDPEIRERLLDVNGDETFDEQDLQRFAEVYGLEDPNTPTIPTARDYGRFDLNGDGATGGIPTAIFDLDRNQMSFDGSVEIGSIDREIEGYPISFNEQVLSDLQILCAYAYSSVYVDANPSPDQEAARTEILGPDHCVGVRMNLGLPTAITDNATLTVALELPAGGGAFVPAPNLFLTLTPTCGSLGANTGQTDATGQFSTTVTPDAGCSNVSVDVVARGTEDGQALATKTATAVVTPDDVSALVSVLVRTGAVPGTIEGFVVPVDFTGGTDPDVIAPIDDAAGFVTQLLVAIGSADEIGVLTVSLGEAVDLTLGFDVPVAQVSVNATGAGCASTLSLTVGDVRRNPTVSFGNGTVGIGGCPSQATINVGNVEATVNVVGSQSNVTIHAGEIRRAIGVGSSFGAASQNLAVSVQTSGAGGLGIRNTVGATVDIQGPVRRTPAELAGSVSIVGNGALTLGPLQGGVVNQLSLESNTFASPPSITLGDILHPGGGVALPKGDVGVVNNEGLELSSLAIGSTIDGDLVITENTGFDNAEASSFASSRTVGGSVSISGNTP